MDKNAEAVVSDVAYQNATARRVALEVEIGELQKRLEAVRREVAEINSFIHQWQRFAGSLPMDSHSYEIDTNIPPPTKRPVNRPREEIGRIVRGLIEMRGRPIPRSSLYADLQAQNVKISGKHPEMVLSTMLWRMPDQFVRLRGHGYWLKEKPWPAAGYDPMS